MGLSVVVVGVADLSSGVCVVAGEILHVDPASVACLLLHLESLSGRRQVHENAPDTCEHEVHPVSWQLTGSLFSLNQIQKEWQLVSHEVKSWTRTLSPEQETGDGDGVQKEAMRSRVPWKERHRLQHG